MGKKGQVFLTEELHSIIIEKYRELKITII